MQLSVALRVFSGFVIVTLLACSAQTPPLPAPTVAQASPTSEAVPPTEVPATVVPPTDTVGVATSTPMSTTVPPTSTIEVTQPTPAPATATPIPATAAPLTASQIAATAIANAAGEECVPAPPQPGKGFIGNPVRGKVLFTDRGCSACHGDRAQGNVGPKLAGTSLLFSAVIQQLRSPRGVMQRYLPADQSDADECDVYTYVRSLK